MPPKVKLPKHAPPALRDFVSCKADTLDLDPKDTGWIPIPKDLGEFAGPPEVTIEQGATPGTVRVTAQWMGGVVKVTLDVSVTDGNLQVQAGGPLGAALQGDINTWLQTLNEFFKENGKKVGDVTIQNEKARIRKVPLAATPPPATTPAIGGTTTTPPPAPPPKPVPTPTPGSESQGGGGCLKWLGLLLIGVIGVGAIGYGAIQIFDGEESVGSTTTTEATAATTTTIETTGMACGSDQSASDETLEAIGQSIEGFTTTNSEIAYPQTWVDPLMRAPCAAADDKTLAWYQSCSAPFTCIPQSSTLFFPGGYPAGEMPTSHNGSEPDAVTGEIGLSANEPFFFTSAAGATFRLTADCEGKISTADAQPDERGVTQFNLPVYRFGQCNATGLNMSLGGSPVALPVDLVAPGGSWLVSPNSYPADTDAMLERLGSLTGSADAPDVWLEIQEIISTLSEASTGLTLPFTDPNCHRFLPHGSPIALYGFNAPGCPGLQPLTWSGEPTRFGRSDGPEVAFHGGYATSAPVAGTSEFLYGGKFPLFPCGPGQVTITVCPEDENIPRDEAMVVVTVALTEPPTIPSRLEIEFVSGAMYTIQIDGVGEGEQTLIGPAGSASTSRALIRNQVVTLIVPTAVVGPNLSYRLAPDQEFTPIVTRFTLPGSTPPAETLEDFLTGLTASLSGAQSLDFALARLHPQVLEFFPDQCPAHIASTVDPEFSITPITVIGEEPFEYQVPDGRTAVVDRSTTVLVEITGGGEVREVEAHFVLGEDGQWAWFTYCAPAPPP